MQEKINNIFSHKKKNKSKESLPYSCKYNR